MKTILLLCILGLAFLGAINAQKDVPPPGGDSDDYINLQGEPSHEQAGEATSSQQEQDKKRHTIWFGCFVLTKNYLAMHNEEVFNSLKGPKYQIYYKKLIGRTLMNCLNTFSYDESAKLLEDIQKQGGIGSIDIKSYFHYLSIDLAQYRDQKISATLTKEELGLFNAAEELEKNLNKRQGGQGGEEGQEGEDESGDGQGYRFEPSVFGINLGQASGSSKAFYMLAIFGGIGVIFYFVYTHLFGSGPRSLAEKIAAEKKKRKEEKKKAKGQ